MANVLLGIHCVVPGCLSTLKRVNQWKTKPCSKPKHKGKSHAQCMCPEPYQFFKFPSEVKLQKLWLERVKRPDLEVNNLTRVCSLHFVEGRPTRRHYFPNVNLHQEDDEADNEEEMEEQQFCNEGEQDHIMQEAVACPQKKGRSGTVSIVPMELLQEQVEEEEGVNEQTNEDEEYEGNLTISRYNYHGSQGGGAYDIPTNSVTITRVTSSVPTTTAICTKPSNRFINTKKTRVDTSSAAGNRFLRTPSSSTVVSSTANLVRNRSQPVAAAQPPPQSRPSILANSKNITNNVLRSTNSTVVRTKVIQQQTHHEEEDECPYDIDMVEGDDDDGDSSELSDIGIDIQPSSAAMKPKYTSKDISTAKTLSSLVVSRQHTIPPPQKETPPSTKPKCIPVLAVAPKSQLQQQQGQPTRTITTNLINSQQNKKPSTPNVLVATTSAKPIVTSSGAGNATKTVIAVAGSSSSVKAEPTTTSVSANTTSSSANIVGAQQPTPPASSTTPSLATYDPTKQQLQIANPVKYIQECHMRIAQLLAEKQSLESRNNDLEARVQELQKSNNDLRREIVHQALNAARRTPQQLNTPTFNLVPTAIMETTSSSADSQNGNASDSTNGGGGSSSKPRIRYVIRRPANLTSATNSTK